MKTTCYMNHQGYFSHVIGDGRPLSHLAFMEPPVLQADQFAVYDTPDEWRITLVPPVAPEQTYRPEFTSNEFDRVDGLDWGTTDAEWALMQESNNNTVKKYLKDTAKRKKSFTAGQAPYTDLLAAMLGDNIISQARHDELALGVPN